MNYANSEYEIIKATKDSDKKIEYWNTAVGLQAVDDLVPSDYLKELAKDNIQGKLDNREIEALLYERYKNETQEQIAERIKECDIVTNRIVELLESPGITFSPISLKIIHGYLFKDIYGHAGKFRDYNISKKEEILNGETVKYANFYEIEGILEYDFTKEKKTGYANLEKEEVLNRITEFTSSIWQVHPFGEGNTRTTAVFIEKYLCSIGFKVNNTMFKDNAKYFRNALVRSNYADYSRHINSTNDYVIKFFENLLFDGNNKLKVRDTIEHKCFEN